MNIDTQFVSLIHVSIDFINDTDPFIEHTFINSTIEVTECISYNGDQQIEHYNIHEHSHNYK